MNTELRHACIFSELILKSSCANSWV